MRLLKLVNNLLDFSRIEAGRVEASFQPTDLAQFTADLASSFRSATDRAGLRLVVDAPPLRQPVFLDRDMWEKAVLNVVSNAFKFTLEGEIRVTVSEDPDGEGGGRRPRDDRRSAQPLARPSRRAPPRRGRATLVRSAAYTHGRTQSCVSVV